MSFTRHSSSDPAVWTAVCVLMWLALLCTVPSAVANANANAPQGETGQAVYRLIVHPDNPITSVERGFAAQAFLKKIRRWPGGETLQPVDLDQGSPVRRRWSEDVLSRSVEAVKSYWQQMIFSGRALPPPEVTNDQQVIDFVLHRAGGIGYVSSRANLRGTKVVAIY